MGVNSDDKLQYLRNLCSRNHNQICLHNIKHFEMLYKIVTFLGNNIESINTVILICENNGKKTLTVSPAISEKRAISSLWLTRREYCTHRSWMKMQVHSNKKF